MTLDIVGITTKIYLGLPSDTTPDEELENGSFETGSGGASNYATGGSISYDGIYKIHTFTPANDGVGTFVVSNEITDAEVLLVAGGGAGSSGGGGGGEVINLTGQTLAAGDYDTAVGAGGTAPYNVNTPGQDGGDTVFNGTTADGGGGGAAVGANGRAGGCGGGGGCSSSSTTTGGPGDLGNGSGNLGYTSNPRPAGGGGGAGGNAPGPSKVDVAANGGVGLACDITGTSVKYGGGGGGGLRYVSGWAGEGKDGGGDGGVMTNGQDGEDGRGGGGGGATVGVQPGDGGDGVLIIKYQDAADYDFTGWTEAAGSGHVFADESIVHTGSQSCKLTGGAEIYQIEDSGITPGNRMLLNFQSYGTTTWEIYDNDNSAIIASGSGPGDTAWQRILYAFEVPIGCTDIKLTFSGNDGYIDAASLLDYGTIIWTLNDDVMARPAPWWEYGIHNNDPDDCVATTGKAQFVLDNIDGKYSPDHESCTAGFEEGMPVKIQVVSEDLAETNQLINGGFEENTQGSGWANYAPITIDHTKVEADHTDFPVPFQGTFNGTDDEPDLRDAANGGDIQNVDSTGTITGADDVPADLVFSLTPDGADPLDHEIELYDKTTGQITAWVRIPTMDADADLTFYVVYGDSSVTTSQENINAVWANYKDVQHYSMASGTSLDSTGNNDATASGDPTYRQTGQTGYAVTLDGDDYFRNAACDYYFSGQNRDTCIMMVADLEDSNSDQYLYATGTNDGVYMRVDDSASQAAFWKIDDGTDDDFGAGTTGMYSKGWAVWHHDIEGGVDHKGYIDGALDYNGSVSGVDDLADNPYIGARDTGTGGIEGGLCEYRARQAAGDPDYIKTEANSMDPDNFISVGTAGQVLGHDTIDGWSQQGFCGVETSEVQDGSYAVQIVNWAAAYSYLYVELAAEPDLEYQLSFQTKGDYRAIVYADELGGDELLNKTGSKASFGSVSDTFTPGCGKIVLQLRADAYSESCYYDAVQLVINETDFTRTKFNGYITRITPSPGQFSRPETQVECVDWVGYLSHTEMGIQTIDDDKTADYGLTQLMGEFENSPPGQDFDTGNETFELIFKDISSQSSMARAFYQMAWNEGGRIYCKGNGVLRFENSTARDEITTPAFVLAEGYSDFMITYGTQNIFNIITLQISNTKVDAAATTTLWEIEDNISIPAGEALTLRFGYTDPTTGSRISAVDVVEPTGADLVKGANITVSGWSAGQDSAQATFTNAGGSAEEVSTFTIKGKGIYEYDKITIEKRDTDSIWQVGEKRYYKRLPLITSPSTADARATAIRDRYAPSHIGKARILVVANQTEQLAKALIEAEPSTRLTVTEAMTGVSTDIFIDKLKYRQDHTMLKVMIEGQVV